MPDTSAYDDLYLYTMELAQKETGEHRQFILQHVVDAQAAQNATADTKPMTMVFALMGLYLHLERGFTGCEVQLAHIKLGKKKYNWPAIALPEHGANGVIGTMSPADVMRLPAGEARNAAIDDWCRSVWAAYTHAHDTIAALMREHGIV
jgi:hypothetical protein